MAESLCGSAETVIMLLIGYTFIQNGLPLWLSSACYAGDLGSIPGLGRSPGEVKGYPLQYSGLENSMDYIVHGVAKSQTWLSDFHFHFHLIQSTKLKKKRISCAKENRVQNEN